MFPTRYFPARFFAPRYWPKVGDTVVVVPPPRIRLRAHAPFRIRPHVPTRIKVRA